jgi:aryl-alcohol dehydrogenase-like predicted oxidoreductase
MSDLSMKVQPKPSYYFGKNALGLRSQNYFNRSCMDRKMEKRRLGTNGPLVSTMGLGCMGMSIGYGPADDAESVDTISRAIDLGVTFFDTADGYGWGHNESLVGKAIRSKRNQLVIATKTGFVQQTGGDGDLDDYLDGSPRHIKEACDASLKRLGVETIDLYYLHRVDPKTPIEDSIGAMADLVKTGKIRHVGISEVKPATIRRAAKVHPIAAVQTEYSLWERFPENEILPTCQELGIGFVSYSPLGRGFLTGTVMDVAQLSSEDFRNILPRFQGDNFEANKRLVGELQQIAEHNNCSMPQLALAWILQKDKGVVPIPGTKHIKHLEDNLGALNVRLSSEEMTRLNDMFPINVAKGAKYPAAFETEA